jgi:hypothetical protein
MQTGYVDRLKKGDHSDPYEGRGEERRWSLVQPCRDGEQEMQAQRNGP